MNYQQFVSAVEVKVKQLIREDMSVCIHSTIKNNGKNRVGITVSEKGINISPTIYLEEYFEQFQKNKSLDQIVNSILKLYEEVRLEHSCEVEQFLDYKAMESRIVYKLIHAEKNEKMLENVPHILYLDLAIVFYVLVEMKETGSATILITNDILHLWKIKKHQLYEMAQKNTKKFFVPSFETMYSVIQKMVGGDERSDEKEDSMYVLTNEFRSFGATCILYDHVLEDIGNQLGENYYVIPSSIHEVIIVPESKGPNRVDLESMVEEINDTQVEEEEILSYKVYYFSRKENRLIL